MSRRQKNIGGAQRSLMGPFAGWRPLTLMSEEMGRGGRARKEHRTASNHSGPWNTDLLPWHRKRGGGPVHIQLPLRGGAEHREAEG